MPNHMKTLLVIVGSILLTACVSEPPPRAPHYWTRDGYNYGKNENYGRNEFERHWAGCNAQLELMPFARTPDQGGGLMGFGTALGDISADMNKRDRFLNNCMRAQGWRDNPGVRPK